MAQVQYQISKLIRSYQAKTNKLITIGTVESASGGRISDKITNVPGSSDYYKGSIVSYSDDIKIGLVGVREETIKRYGAVSPEVAIEMAQGGRKLLKVCACLADTGIAGPTGATHGKPVGLFYIALSTEDTNTVLKYNFQNSRENNKKKATEAALTLLKKYLEQCFENITDDNLEEKHVVTCFLEYEGRILILRRSHKVGTYKRSWAGVSGYVEADETEQAFTEIREETELYKKDLKLIKKGDPLEIIDKNLNRKWVVHPFLLHVKAPEKIRTDWEHTEMKWIKPKELSKYKTVPGLKETLDRVIR